MATVVAVATVAVAVAGDAEGEGSAGTKWRRGVERRKGPGMTTSLSGIGIGWRPEISGLVSELPGLGFAEVIAESVDRATAEILGDLGVPVIPHGTRLSLGGAEPVTAERIDVLARCATILDAPLVSEHLAFVRSEGLEAGHLLPLPRTRASLKVLVDNIRRTTDALPAPLAVENIATLFDWPDDEFSEGEFIAEILERTDALLLLDVANVYACARNRGTDPARDIARIPLERVAYCHVAGGQDAGEIYHDTHCAPVPDAVLELVARAAAAGVPAFMLERDGDYPPAREMLTELDAIADAAGAGRITVGSRWWADA